MDKNKPRPNGGSSWNDENERNVNTNPNRRQQEDQDMNVESPRSGQRASTTDPGSSESTPDSSEQLHKGRQSDSGRGRDTDTE